MSFAMLRTVSTVICIAVLATPSLADECPTAQTAKQGFVLERQGSRAEVRPSENHFVHVVNLFPGGKKQDAIYYRGLFLISRFDDTAKAINVPVSDIRTLFPLEVKAKRALTYAPAQPSKIGTLVSLELTIEKQDTLKVGDCEYKVLVIRNRYLNAEGRVTGENTDFYSPDLGFTLAKRYDDNPGRSTTVQYERIRPLNPGSRL
jgi:hypothetical protein